MSNVAAHVGKACCGKSLGCWPGDRRLPSAVAARCTAACTCSKNRKPHRSPLLAWHRCCFPTTCSRLVHQCCLSARAAGIPPAGTISPDASPASTAWELVSSAGLARMRSCL